MPGLILCLSRPNCKEGGGSGETELVPGSQQGPQIPGITPGLFPMMPGIKPIQHPFPQQPPVQQPPTQ
ncbi:hypothetical protein BSL78_20492, partial [Apostichopus japonicus]